MEIEEIKKRFNDCKSSEAIYQLIISMGKELPSLGSAEISEENRVPGCQSRMYLSVAFQEGKLYFAAASDALISAGLAALLIKAYNGSSPEYILQAPPSFLDELGIPALLTPGRANGLASLFLKMKQEALKTLIAT